MKRIASVSLPSLLALLVPLTMTHAFAQQPKFDLEDAHASTTPRWFAQNNGAVLRDGRYVIRDATLLNLIETTYGVTEDTVGGGPNWLDTDIFDVIAKVPGGTTPATAKLMLQALLVDRFGLVTRNEKRPMPRYVLTVRKGGSKLKPAAGAVDPGCQQQTTGLGPGAGGVRTKATCHNLTTQQIAENLRQIAGLQINSYLPRDVFDSTGLAGKWDFELEFTPIAFLEQTGKDGITLFDAVSKQPGLKWRQSSR